MPQGFYVESPNSQLHEPLRHAHPENVERLRHIRQGIMDAGLFSRGLQELSVPIPAEGATKDEALFDELRPIHETRYLQKLARSCLMASKSHEQYLDVDTYITRSTLDVVRGSIEAVKMATRHALTERSNAFCAIRPPGHHAGRKFFGGFCVVNFSAYAASLCQQLGAEKVAIIDWDAHYGNGTQSIFNREPSVFYLSLHAGGSFPRGANIGDPGEGTGKGYSRNIALRDHTGDPEYMKAFKSGIHTIQERMDPDAIVVSAGFDAHAWDPIGNLNLSSAIYGDLTDVIKQTWQGTPIISVLEGGYDYEALRTSSVSHVRSLIA